MPLIDDVALDKVKQTNIELIGIMESKLSGKIDELGKAMDTKMQSLENSFSALQDTMNKLMLTFLKGQEDRHKELVRISNCLNDHEGRIKSLERK